MIEHFLDALWASVARFGAPQSTLYWLYLVSALAIALVVYCLRRPGGGFLAFCFPPHIYAQRSAKLDFGFFLANIVVFGAVVAPLLLSSATAAQAVVAMLVAVNGIPATQLAGGVWADLGVTLAAFVAADFAFFGSHWLQHRIPALWEFHKVHHAAEVLHPLTAFRVHPVDQALDVTLMGMATGVVIGVSAYVFGTSVGGLGVLGVNAFVFLFNLAGVHLRHSHVRLSYGPILDRIVVSPAVHQFHHSRSPAYYGKNLGGYFAVWDWMAGTLRRPSADEALEVGLADDEHAQYSSLSRLFLLPFARNAARWRRA